MKRTTLAKPLNYEMKRQLDICHDEQADQDIRLKDLLEESKIGLGTGNHASALIFSALQANARAIEYLGKVQALKVRQK